MPDAAPDRLSEPRQPRRVSQFLAPADDPTRILRHFRQELRNPINEIVGYSSLIREGIEDDGTAESHSILRDLNRIEAAGERLLAHTTTFFDEKAGGLDAGALCHTLRSPLTAVIGYSDLLLEESADYGEEVAGDLRKIHAAGSHLLELVDTFLDVFRAELSHSVTVATVDAAARPEVAAPSAPPHPSAECLGGRALGRHVQLSGALLVVDDDDANRDLLSRRLGRLGCSVTLAVDGDAALELLQQYSFDLVLLDLRMPRVSGFEVLAQIRAQPALLHLPVIILSASDELDAMVQCVELGADEYLSKPVHPTLLVARVRRLLEQKRLRDQEAMHLRTIRAQAAELAEWGRTLEERVARQVEELERVGRLRRFLSPQVADLIVSSGQEELLASHGQEVTVLFCDLRGYTAFADYADPDTVIRVLSRYHAILGPLIHTYQGTLERFAGDGLMVFFNDPIPTPDHCERAVGLALAMREEVGKLLQELACSSISLGFGVGVARGYATLGRIGFEGRFDYACLGSATNRAARLCAEAAAGQILVDAPVFDAIAHRYRVERLPDLMLKGFRQPVPTWNVTGIQRNS